MIIIINIIALIIIINMGGVNISKCSRNCLLKYNRDDNYIGWLVEILGPVLMGSKPAELLSLANHSQNTQDKINDIHKYIGKCRRIEYKIFKYNNKSMKILFYNPITLDKHLADKRNNKFLISLGYSKEYNLSNYIDLVIEKMEQGVIPDEIGVFLGYPLKDIIGYMGHPSLKLTKISGWRVYGNPTVSDIRRKEFIDSKQKVKDLLRYYRPEKLLLSI